MEGQTPGSSTEASRQPSSHAAANTMPPPPVPMSKPGGEVSYFSQHGEASTHHNVGQKAPIKRPGRITIKKSGTSAAASGAAPVAVRHSARIPVRSAKARDNAAQSARIKLKFSSKGEQHKLAPGHFMSPFGEYTRELDEDPEEPLAFEEQFILRVPKEVAMGDPKRGVKGLNQLLDERKEVDGVWFKFKDARRAVFHHADQNYAAKLVDLPCIIESQKTLDKKRLFKVADISQMMIVEYPVPSEDSVVAGNQDPEAFVWQHGLTPPLHYVRQRRWRKRKIGDKEGARIEAEVERLLKLDNEARNSSLSFVDVEPAANASQDEEGYDEDGDFEGSQWDGSELQNGTPRSVNDGESAFGDDMAEGDVGMELSAALNDEQEEMEEHSEDDEDEEEDDVEDEEEDEDEEMAELRQQQKLFDQEVRDLQQIVDRKQAEIQSISSVILKVRAQNGLARPMQELRAKTQARDENQARIDTKIQAKEAAKLLEAERRAAENAEKEKAAAAADAAKEAGGDEGEDDEDDLFGENEDDEDGEAAPASQPRPERHDSAEQPELDVWAEDSDEGESDDDGEEDANMPTDVANISPGQVEHGTTAPEEQPTKAEPGSEAAPTPAPVAIQWGFDVDEDDDEED